MKITASSSFRARRQTTRQQRLLILAAAASVLGFSYWTTNRYEPSVSRNLVVTQAIHDAILNLDNSTSEFVWEQLIAEGKNQQKLGSKVGVAMEIGMHKATQCLQAAQGGLQAHCVEPSPNSFARVQRGVEKAAEDVQQRVHLYPNVASDESGKEIEFMGKGGTGDHVGAWSSKLLVGVQH